MSPDPDPETLGDASSLGLARPRNSPSVFGSLTDELMKIFISQSSDALNPHQSVLNYHQSDSQISDKSDEPCFFWYI
jgi:hypothetical protein